MQDNQDEVALLKQAIEGEDLDAIKALMTGNPSLHRAPLGYGENGPLTWVAECRVPRRPPSDARLAIAKWMIENGSDVHQGGDGPLMRASLNADRIQMMELLVANGANVNAEWNGRFPILWAACECVAPVPLRWLLEHGANPDCPGRKDTALDYLIATYVRSPDLAVCVDLLLEAGGKSRYDLPGVMPLLRGCMDQFARLLDGNPELVHRRYPELDCGSSGARRLLLTGASLLHVAAEFGNAEAARLLLARGADPNARALLDADGVGGQTPLFHCASQYDDHGLEVAKVLLAHGASLSVSARLPGHYEHPLQVVVCTPLEYAVRFPGEDAPGSNARTVELLRRACTDGV